jgi:hypothetical protein
MFSRVIDKITLLIRSVTVVACVVMATAAHGQGTRNIERSVTLPRTQLSVKEVMETIGRQTPLLFAFDGRTFDISRTVQSSSAEASVGILLDLITSGTGSSWLTSGPYIVIHHSPQPAPLPSSPPPLTNDVYVASDPRVEAFGTRPAGSPPPRPEVAVVQTVPEPQVVPDEIFAPPYSVWRDPDIYSPIRRSLPRWAVKTDLLYGAATLTPNIALEVGLTSRSTVELTWGWNQINHEGLRNDNRKLNHGLARVEYRRWLCERYNGHFFGAHAVAIKYNIALRYRWEGSAFGAGVTWGYHLPLSRRWGVEFSAGVGVARYDHTRFECARCGTELGHSSGVWFGPTRAGIDLVFLFGR